MTHFDPQALTDYLQGDRDFLTMMVSTFLTLLPASREQIVNSVQAHDARQLREAAHQLKSRLRYLQAEHLAQQAQALEDCGRDSRLKEAAEVLASFLRDLEELVVELERVRDAGSHALANAS